MPQTEAMQPDHNGNATYISPSDTIMSPTTKKLSEMKGKRFASAKPQSLFAKTVGKQALMGQDQSQGQIEEQADHGLGREHRDSEEEKRQEQSQ